MPEEKPFWEKPEDEMEAYEFDMLADCKGYAAIQCADKDKRIKELSAAEKAYCRNISLQEKQIKSLNRMLTMRDNRIEKLKAHADLMEADNKQHKTQYLTACDLLSEATENAKKLNSQIHHLQKENEKLNKDADTRSQLLATLTDKLKAHKIETKDS